MSRPRRLTSFLIGSLVITLSGCSLVGLGGDQNGSSATKNGEPGSLNKYYAQKIKWNSCGEENTYECAALTVPMDYEQPEQGDLDIQITRAKGEKNKPVLLYNPGGPGFSGLTYLHNLYRSFPKKIQDQYMIVSFDPRGVAKSTPIQCLQGQEIDDLRAASYNILDPKEQEADAKDYQEYFNKCREHTGTTKKENGEGGNKVKLEFFGSDNVVKDMDVIRAVLGQEKLNFIGQSYGSKLGLLYSSRFPQKTGKMVLDAVVDPFISNNDLLDSQMKGIDDCFADFVKACQGMEECPFTSLDDAKQKIGQLLASLKAKPMATDDPKERPLTRALAASAIVGMLYTPENYQNLVQGLLPALNPQYYANEKPGSALLYYSDQLSGRSNAGTYPDSGDANRVIHFLDFNTSDDPAQANTFYQNLVKKYPLFATDYIGDYFRFQNCSFCQAAAQAKSKQPQKLNTEKMPPLLIFANTNDPATDRKMAENIHRQLKESRLVTVELFGHESLLSNNKCADNALVSYLIDGKLPDKDLSCPAR